MKRLLLQTPIFAALLVCTGIQQSRAQTDPHASLTEQERAAVLRSTIASEPVRRVLNGNRYRVFALEAAAVKKAGAVIRETHVLLYDYTNNKGYQITSDIRAGVPGTAFELETLGGALPPHAEEYAEAREMVLGLERVKTLMQRPNVRLQDAFPVGSPPPCEVNRCIEMHVIEAIPGTRMHLLLLVTVDLSARRVAEVRQPVRPTAIR